MHKVITFLFLETLCERNINTIFSLLKIIKLSAIDSTNTYLKELSKREELEDLIFVVAKKQSRGRGQMGTRWQSKVGKSLTFSMFKKFDNLPLSCQANITFAVSLGVKLALDKLHIPKCSIKWPNDIMSYQKKVAGILIENHTKGTKLVSAIIGIGLNVNEEEFDELPYATSLLLNTGVVHNLDEVLHLVSQSIIDQLARVEQKQNSNLREDYQAMLFRKEEISVFEDTEGNRFNGLIKGVSKMGEILVETDDEQTSKFQMKEIKMLL